MVLRLGNKKICPTKQVIKEYVLKPNVAISGDYCYLNGNTVTTAILGRNTTGNTYANNWLRVYLDNIQLTNNNDAIEISYIYNAYVSGSNDCGIMNLEGINYYIRMDTNSGKFRMYTNATGSQVIHSTNISLGNFNYLFKFKLTNKTFKWDYSTNNGESFTNIVNVTWNDSVIQNVKVFNLLWPNTYIIPSSVDLSSLKITYNEDNIDIYTDKLNKTYNITPYGYIVNNNGILTGFKTNNSYAKIPCPDFSNANNFEIVTKFLRTGAKINNANNNILSGCQAAQFLVLTLNSDYKIGAAIGNSTNTGWQTTESSTYGNTATSTGTWYWYKFVFTGSEYAGYLSTDGENYTQEFVYNSSEKIGYVNSTMNIGIGRGADNLIFVGNIDLNECYIKVDGETVWQGVN